ncbi:MAG TPA: methionine--tRNA ligase [Steroidobacteraceae bacterium]|nr:methionine--tRNA ligase [Steroidobacteraceae bacterium]
MSSLRPLFITTALPFANGPFHIGHIMEYIQADIWVRFQRMQGRAVHFVCADDTHGAPIMLKAEAEGITPEELVQRIGADRPRYLQGFHLSFDHWHSTHSPENFELSTRIYRQLQAAGLIYVKLVEQFYDPVKQMFLPDRYIKGECPVCHTKDQYGDACENCSSVYAPIDLIDPYSTLTGVAPVRKSSDHYFFRLSDPKCIGFMKSWLDTPGRLQSSVANKAREWLGGGGDQALSDWDISRDAPYFGIPIPDAPGKFFYVWLDAPIGYLASLKNYFDSGKARAKGEQRSFEEFLASPDVEQIHFIGKDIIYFHTLFWPAMLHFAQRKVPNHVYVHGFITLSGAKMSKSRGTGISPLRYLELGLNPEWLRYYIAAKLNANVEDIDFNPEDFVARVNSDLVGKYVNIASRTAGFISKRFGGRLAAMDPRAQGLSNDFHSQGWSQIGSLYVEREFGKAMREIGVLLDRVNQYIDANKPWELAKVEGEQQRLHAVCSTSLNFFWYLTVLLRPVLPETARKVQALLRLTDAQMQWGQHAALPAGHEIAAYEHLMTRAEAKQLDALLGLDQPATEPAAPAPAAAAATQGNGEVTVEDFAKLDLRIARIVAAEVVEGADKLLKLTLDLGEGQRTVFAGIRSAYAPEQLPGRMTLVLANLKPRKMRFGVSEGMVLAAGPGGKDIFLLAPDSGATAGMKVK